ncbi:MAG TPA: CheR family methyltransferase, partial [Hymenobacter sp.]|nr:CheR family methyltransferase [Hymenobacter sp.]
GVTRFFRDKEAFDHVKEKILSTLLGKRGSEEEVRIWVAGCATGEEAYSLAIMVHEVLGERSSDHVKIFATDVHRASLETAAMGFYTEQGLADVNAQRKQRYFKRVKDGYCVCSEIRKLVVFAPHDVVKDAPFTRLDLVTCRNLLIYLDANAQKKVMSLFHFALKAGGIMFLGPSESPGDLTPEFEPVERHWKIFRKKRDIRLPHDFRLPLAGSVLQPPRLRPKPAEAPAPDPAMRKAQEVLLQAFVPPSILIDGNHQVVHTYSGGGRYLNQHPDGRVSLHILEMVDPELKLIINGALHRLTKEKDPITYSGVRVTTPDGQRRCRVTTRPVEQGAETSYLISIQPEEDLVERPGPDVDLDAMTHARILALESELQYTGENLQATLEEMETANEELQASNEELVASNEELQSTNEELHSVNEELYTVNTEHQHKIRQLTEMTEDMENLFAASDVGTVFLDRDLCVRKFTPEIGKTFHLLPQDVGRHIDNFAHSLDLPELVERLAWVLTTERRYEAQV